jgi:maltose O-acetyltransferase
MHSWRLKKLCQAASTVRFTAEARIANSEGRPDRITIGEHCLIYGRLQTFFPGGRIDIGSYCFVSEGTRIWSASHISIGNRVLISHNVNILDSNSHSQSALARHQEYKDALASISSESLQSIPAKPVIIEDDVWIGFNATILKGVRIGRGAIVGANTVITKDVPPYTIMVGNPARAVGSAFE